MGNTSRQNVNAHETKTKRNIFDSWDVFNERHGTATRLCAPGSLIRIRIRQWQCAHMDMTLIILTTIINKFHVKVSPSIGSGRNMLSALTLSLSLCHSLIANTWMAYLKMRRTHILIFDYVSRSWEFFVFGNFQFPTELACRSKGFNLRFPLMNAHCNANNSLFFNRQFNHMTALSRNFIKSFSKLHAAVLTNK